MHALSRRLFSSKERTVVYSKLYESGSDLFAYQVAVGPSGAVYVFGRTSAGPGVLCKIANESISWCRKISNATDVMPRALAVDASENVYIAGSTFYESPDVSFVAKYNSAGSLQWKKEITTGGSSDAQANGMTIDDSGNVYIGIASTFSPAKSLAWAKLNSSGVMQWQRKCSTDILNSLDAAHIPVAVHGSILYIVAADDTANCFRVIAVDVATGATFQAQKSISISAGTPGNGIGIEADNSGNIYVVIQSTNVTYVAVIKFNSSLDLQWAKSFNIYGTATYTNATIITASDSVIVFADRYAVEIDFSGALLNSKLYGSSVRGGDYGNSLYAIAGKLYKSPSNWSGNGSNGSYSLTDAGLSLSTITPTISATAYTNSVGDVTIGDGTLFTESAGSITDIETTILT